MKLTGIAILKWNGDAEANSLGMSADVSSYGYFQRGAVKEMMAFVARTVAKRTQPGQRQSVQQVPHLVFKHGFACAGGRVTKLYIMLSVVLLADYGRQETGMH